MDFLRTATTSGLLALTLAAPGLVAQPAAADTAIELAQAQQAPETNEEGDRRKSRREGGEGRGEGRREGGEGRREGGGEGRREGGEGRRQSGEGAEGRREGGEGRRQGGERGEGRRENGEGRRQGGEGDERPARGQQPPAAQQPSPPPQQAPARREAPQPPPEPPRQREATPPPQPPPQQAPARREAPTPPAQQQQATPPPRTPDGAADRLRDIRDRMQSRDERRDDRQERREDRREDRQERREDRRDVRENRREERGRDRQETKQERRGIESFRERFRSRAGEDKAFQDFRRGRADRVRERQQRPDDRAFRRIDDLKSKRQERRDGNRVVIEEPDKRMIIRDGNRTVIRSDENERLRRNFRDVRREKRNGRDVTIGIGLGGAEIYTEFDDDGRARRRWRRGRDGREVVLFDNSRSSRWSRRHGRGHGGLFEAIIDLPPPRIRIPRDEYIVDYDRASEEDLYDTLSAPPVEEIDERYSLDEIRSSYSLRDRMRRIDLDTINFAFGSWEVEERDYDRLERVARAMRRVLRRDPDEMFLIEGHTDAVGSDEDNLTLSDRRAESVARILSEEFGIPSENLTTQGYGEQFLKIPTSEPERANRRVAMRRITPLLAR
jgi:outer membrane protein OmpA-like peptidoglycan-associated protein